MFGGIEERSDYGRGMGAVGGAVSREAIVRQIHPLWVGAEHNLKQPLKLSFFVLGARSPYLIYRTLFRQAMEKVPIFRHGRSLAVTAEECKYNTRIKLYPLSSDDNSEWRPIQMMCSTSHIFNPNGVTENKSCIAPKVFTFDEGYSPDEKFLEAEKKQRAIRRAKANLYDYIRCNLDLNYFVTLTFSPDHIERDNYDEVIKKFNQWTSNRVKRNGFKYVGVVERHKKSNGLHFHLLTNDVLDVVLSGTVKVPNHKKPIKVSTADRYRIPEEQWQFVYNIPSWKWGFSTALEIENDDSHLKVSHYLVKYLTKDFEKIGGRYYYSGGKLLKPKYEYCNTSYNEVEESYSFEVPNGKYKVVNYDE